MAGRSLGAALLVVHLAISCAVAQKVLPTLTCYNGSRGVAQAFKFTNIKEPLVCVRYQFKCSKGDSGCSQIEQARGVYRWAHTIVAVSTCQLMTGYAKMRAPVYKHVLCCTTPLCNRPDPTAVPPTKVLPGTITTPMSG